MSASTSVLHRKGRRALAIALGLLALCVAGILLAPALFGWLANRALPGAGLAGAELHIEHLGAGSAQATLRLGTARAPARIDVDYAPGDLLAGRLGHVRITGLEVPLARTPGGDYALAWQQPTPKAAPTGSAFFTLPALPVHRLDVRDAVLRVPVTGTAPLDIPFTLQAEPDAALGTRIEGRVGPLAGASAHLGGTVDAQGRAQLALTVQVADAGALAAALGEALPLRGTLQLVLDVRGSPGSASPLAIGVAIDARDLGWGDWLHDGVFDLRGELVSGPQGYVFRTGQPLALQAWPGPALARRLPPTLAQQPFRLALQPPAADTPLLHLGTPGGSTLAFAGTASLTLGRAGLGGTLGGTWRGERFEATLDDGELGLLDGNMAGRGLALHLVLDPAAREPVGGRLHVDELRSTASPALHAPLRVDGHLSGAPGEVLAFHVDLDTLDERAHATLDGRHSLRDGRGEARLATERLRLDPATLPLGALVPVLAGIVREARGTVALDVRYGWGGTGNTERAELLVQDVDLVTPWFAARRIATVLRADRLLPLRLPPGQPIAIAELDAGLLLGDGLIEIAVDDERVHVLRAGFGWVGGRLEVAPFATRFGVRTQALKIRARQLDLGELFALVSLQGLSASGQVDGELPVVLNADGGLSIRGGALEADGPGLIRYQPETPPAFLTEGQGAFALEALRNFHYDTLGLSLEGGSGADMRLRLSLRGANPDFQEGHPVAFNLNLSGALLTILQRSLENYRLPDSVRERLEHYGESP